MAHRSLNLRGRAALLVLAIGGAAVGGGLAHSAIGASALATTKTTVKVPTSAVAGASVQLTAQVTPTPTGASKTGVTFLDNGITISPMRSSTTGRYAWSTTALGVGAHSISAHFSGDAGNAASNSAPAPLTIGQAGANAATMTFSSSPASPVLGGTPLSFTVTMTGKAGVPNPTGSVTFKNGAATMSAGRSLTNGSVTLPWSNGLPLGTNSLSAIYSGDANYSSVTQALSVVVTPSPNDKLVQHLYTDLVGGQDPSGEAFWVSQLSKGVSRYNVAYGFTQSVNYASNLVSSMYVKEMGRPVDTSGGSYWTGRLRSGLSPEAFAASLVASDEMFNSPTFGQGNIDTYIAAVYKALLGRPADPGGAAYWHNYLVSGNPHWQLTLNFAYSKEWLGITVTRLYNQFLRSTPDQPGLDFWVSKMQSGTTDYQIAATLVSSDQYFSWAQSH